MNGPKEEPLIQSFEKLFGPAFHVGWGWKWRGGEKGGAGGVGRKTTFAEVFGGNRCEALATLEKRRMEG